MYRQGVRLVTWNIRFGGKHERKPEIADAITRFGADVVVITEARMPSKAGNLQQLLAERGWEHQLMSPVTSARDLGVLAVSRTPITQLDVTAPPLMPYRQIAFCVEGFDLPIVGLYVPPLSPSHDRAVHFWNWIDSQRHEWAQRQMIVCGDLNSGQRGPDEQQPGLLQFTRDFQDLLDAGLVDAYRRLHPEGDAMSWWWSSGMGMRLDHCLVPAEHADRICFADYVVGMGPVRLVKTPGDGRFGPKGLSDHAAMLVDFDTSKLPGADC